MGGFQEPKWHHRLRQSRSRATRRLQAYRKLQPRLRRRDILLLQAHHGSEAPLHSRRVQNSFLDMTSWQCRFCYTWDSVQTIHCSTCNCHWKQAQLKRSKSRRFSSCLFSVAFEGKRMSIGTLKTNWSVRDGKSIAYPLTFVCVVSILI